MFVALKALLAKQKLPNGQFMLVYLATMGGLLILFLAFTGKLNPLFGVLGAALPFLSRAIGLAIQGMQFAAIFRGIKRTVLGKGPSAPPAKSEIHSRFIHMVLFHDTGEMDGTVLEGQFKDARLSSLSLEQLLALLTEVSSDADSQNLLHAYLDREHEDWNADASYQEAPASDGAGEMDEAQALDILGLEQGASPDDVKEAHKRMMQKVHPDRGGSTWLAAKTNAAKDYLLTLYG